MKLAFFFDMDGTLYDRRFHDVSEKTFKAMLQLQKQGHIVALATSRCNKELEHLPSCMRDFPFDVKIIDGGALILDGHNNVLESHPLEPFLVNQIDDFCKENNLVYRYSTVNGNYWGTPVDLSWHQIWHDLYLTTPVYKPYDMDEALNILLRFDSFKQEQDILKLVSKCGIVRYYDCYEIRANGINKAVAIQKMIEQYDVDKVYCFGDGHNDIEMLTLADVGVAMGNAKEELKKVADVVIDDIDKEPIYKFFIENKLVEEV